MEPNEMHPNSYKYKEEQQRRPEKAISGTAITKKKSGGRKLFDFFINDSAEEVKNYVVDDVLLPGVKDVFADVLKQTIDMLFYGRTKGKKKDGYVSYTSYSSYSSKPSSQSSKKTARGRSIAVDDVILDNRPDAEITIDTLKEIIERYGQASLNDLYDIVGMTSNRYTNEYYGWVDLSDARVVRVREGWLLDLPRCIDLK